MRTNETGRHRASAVATLGAAWILAVWASPAAAWPWAESVILYNPGPGIWQGVYRDETRVLGHPRGGGVTAPDNSSVITLGDRGTVTDGSGNIVAYLGTITLDFGDRVLDDHRNPHGLDFIVFSNAIWADAKGTVRYQEPAFVEVSEDGINWFLMLPNILPANLKGAPQPNQDTGTSSTILRGYAEYTPTLELPAGVRPEQFYTIPDRPSYAGDADSLLIDAGSGGGDAFDLKWAVRQASPGVPLLDAQGKTIPANLPAIRHVRITDAVQGDYQDPLAEISAEIDAVASVLPSQQPLAEALREPDGVIVRFNDAVVVRTDLDGGLCVHALDNAAGTRVLGGGVHAAGDRISVIGRLYHRNDETFVAAIYCDPAGTAPVPRPVSVPLRTLTSQTGLSPGGMVVKTWGRVRSKGLARLFELTGADGAKTTVMMPFPLPQDGSLVRVTGASRKGLLTSSIYVNSSADVELLAPK